MSLALDPSTAKANRDPLVRGLLVLALLLAALRFVGLGRWSLWLDEALTLADGWGEGGDLNPFGYALFAWFYGLVPGRPDEFLMRLPAAVFGALTIVGLLWAFRPYLGARASALAAFFLAASTWHLYWSQVARFYTLAQLLSLCGGGLLLRALQRGSASRTALALLFLCLAALTHPSAAFVIGPLLVVPWIARWLDWMREPPGGKRAWSLFSAAGLAALMIGSGWALRAWLRWRARQGDGDFVHFALTTGYLVTPPLGLAFLIGALRRLRSPAAFVPLAVALLGLGGAAVASLFVRVSAQYVFVLQPWIAVGAALAFFGPVDASVPARPSRVLPLALALLVALPGLAETVLYFGWRNGDRPHWREAYAYVFEHKGPDDLVFGMDAPVAEFYLRPDSLQLRRWTSVTWLDDWRSRLPIEWARYPRRAWFVVNEELFDDWKGDPAAANRVEVERFLHEECAHAASFQVPLTPRDLDVDVFVYDPAPRVTEQP